MNNDDHLKQAFQNLRFADEPPMASTADDVHRGQRGLRRRRVTTLSSGVAVLAVVATGAAIALPGVNGGQQPDVAGSPSAPFDEWPKTSQRMQDSLVEHLDPDEGHLDLAAATYSADINAETGTESLDHLTVEVPWEAIEGAGSVTAAVSAPIEASMAQPADSPDYMRNTIADILGPGFDTDRWTEYEGSKVDGTVWVFSGAPDDPPQFAAIQVREDTSVAGVAVDSDTTDGLTPDILIEQAVALVTDAGLAVDPSEFNIGDTPTADPEDNSDDLIPQELQFPKTTQRLLDVARRHLNEDIPDDATGLRFTTARPYGSTDPSYGGTGGGFVGLDLSIRGPSEWSGVEVMVLTPNFASSYFASQPWTEFPHKWIEDTIPGTDTKVWIADETQWDQDIAENMAFAIAYEQADGSIVVVDVYQGSGIDIEQAYDLVTDPDLQIDPAEATDEYWRLVAEKHGASFVEGP